MKGPRPLSDAILGLGSNVGDKAGNIDAAIAALTKAGDVRVVARSHTYRTKAWGKTDQDWFANACISVATDLSPRALLVRCQEVERDLGRVRTEHWGPRVIDIDILFYRDQAIREPDLVVPHPLIGARAFVLAPLLDVNPDAMIGHERARDLLARLPDRADVVRWAG